MRNSLCTNCGYVGLPIQITSGSTGFGCILVCLFIVPGLIYAIWQHFKSGKGCPQCRKIDSLIPIDSHHAKQILAERGTPYQPSMCGLSAGTPQAGQPRNGIPLAVVAIVIVGVLVVGARGDLACAAEVISQRVQQQQQRSSP